jgi:prolyl-tRNA editing enzyme YbaK/EbsC (Cys-tRNA(Pro) deacylase)
MVDAMPSAHGNLDWKPLLDHLDLVAAPVADAARAGLVPSAQVAAIDGTLADTAAFCAAYDVGLEHSANCVVVLGRRGETRTRAAVMVLGTDRADVNRIVRKHLGMTSGGITPVGLPEDWPVLVDQAVATSELLVIGGGVRDAKLLVSGAELAALPGTEVLELRVG